jgi:uncharacterized protein DUF3455
LIKRKVHDALKAERSEVMKSLHTNRLRAAAVTFSLITAVATAYADRTPTVPDALSVPAGNKVEFHAYAVGVQIYSWNTTTGQWGFVAPEAVLHDADGNVVGIHYAGPTWQTGSGSKVVGARIAGVTMDANSIPWLLLQAKTAQGPGVLGNTTYVQRVSTVGGLAPSTAGTVNGEIARVPYRAEYYFYRAPEPNQNRGISP